MSKGNQEERMQRILAFVQAIGVGDFSKRLEITESDELASVEVGVNLMATDLQDLAAGNVRKERALQQKVDELEKFQKMTVGRELRMIELKKELDELRKRNVQE